MRPGRATPRRWQAPVTGATVTSNDVKIRPWRPAPRPSPRPSTRRRCAGCSTDSTAWCASTPARSCCGRSSRERPSSSRPTHTGPRSATGRSGSPPPAAPRCSFRRSSAASAGSARRSRASRRSRCRDLSLLVKCGVQFGLFGGAVHHLGTRKHHERYLERIASFELPGAFAMSESGHGSNVQRVQTIATYDADADEFVIDTPTTTTARTTSATPPATAGWRPSSPARSSAASGAACTRARAAARRRRHRPSTGVTDRGLRPQARPQRRRQRPPLVRRHPGPAREPARPLRDRSPRRRVLQPDPERGPSASSRCSAR